MQVIKQHEGSQGVTMFFQYPSLRYFDEFMRLKCAPDLLKLKLFPNAKEVSESFAALRAVRKIMKAESFGDDSIKLIDVACGSTPRTAALFAFLTKWKIFAVDPVLKHQGRYDAVNNLTCHSKKIEEVEFWSDSTVVVTAVHAHVKLDVILKRIHAPRIVLIAMPCCQPLELKEEPEKEYEDYGCWSPHRTVKVWDINYEGAENGGVVEED
jgi:hypothetical protein